jgi:hypothetical protein
LTLNFTGEAKKVNKKPAPEVACELPSFEDMKVTMPFEISLPSQDYNITIPEALSGEVQFNSVLNLLYLREEQESLLGSYLIKASRQCDAELLKDSF